MSIKISVIQDGVELAEVFTPPMLKEMCLFKCLSNKDILTKKVEVDDDEGPTSSNLASWKKYRLKETLNGVLVEDLLDLGDNFIFMLTRKYVPVLAAIRMSQPENLVKLHVTNTRTLKDDELEWLMSGGNVKSLDIHGCRSLQGGSLETINTFGGKLGYLRIGNSSQVLPKPLASENPNSPILRTPNVKTFIVGGIKQGLIEVETLGKYWKFLLHDFITKLKDLQINDSYLLNFEFLLPAKATLLSLTLQSCVVIQSGLGYVSIFKLENLKFLDLNYYPVDWGSSTHPAQRVIIALPKLTVLNINVPPPRNRTPGVRGLEVASGRRRLEFLGTMCNEEELRNAKRFAIKVAGFGSSEGEFCALEFYASRSYNCMEIMRNTLDREWVHSHNTVTVTVVSLLLKTLTNNGFNIMPNLGLKLLNILLTQEVAAKLGSYMVNQCVNCIEAKLMNFNDSLYDTDPYAFNYAIQLMTKLEAELESDHYATILVLVLEAAIKKLDSSVPIGLQVFMENVAQLVRMTVDRFPETFATPSEIQSICCLIRKLLDAITWNNVFLKSFCSMISSLEKLCLNCAPFKTMFQAADGKWVIFELLAAINGVLPDIHSVTLPLLGILKILLDDSTFLRNHHAMTWRVAAELENLLLSNNSKWKVTENPVIKQNTIVTMKSIAALLNSLHSDEKSYYLLGDSVSEVFDSRSLINH